MACGGFQPAAEQASFFGFVPEGTPPRGPKNLSRGAEAGSGRAPLA